MFLREFLDEHSGHGGFADVRGKTVCKCGQVYTEEPFFPMVVSPATRYVRRLIRPDVTVRPDINRVRRAFRSQGIEITDLTNYANRALMASHLRPQMYTAVLASICRHHRFTNVEDQVAYVDATVTLDTLVQNEDGSYLAALGKCPLFLCGKVFYTEPNAEMIAMIIRDGGRQDEEMQRMLKADEQVRPRTLEDLLKLR
jgi:hypothetical protein